jgi:hypothetical protein
MAGTAAVGEIVAAHGFGLARKAACESGGRTFGRIDHAHGILRKTG